MRQRYLQSRRERIRKADYDTPAILSSFFFSAAAAAPPSGCVPQNCNPNNPGCGPPP